MQDRWNLFNYYEFCRNYGDVEVKVKGRELSEMVTLNKKERNKIIQDSIYSVDIEELDLDTRTFNTLKRCNINTIGDVVILVNRTGLPGTIRSTFSEIFEECLKREGTHIFGITDIFRKLGFKKEAYIWEEEYHDILNKEIEKDPFEGFDPCED